MNRRGRGRPVPLEEAGSRLVPATVWKVLLAFAAAAAVVVLSQGVVGDGPAPPVGLLLAWGSVIILCTGGALALVVRSDLSLPTTIALYAVGYNALIVAVKFVLAPYGLYEVNQVRPLTGWVAVDQTIGIIAAAGVVLLLYAGVYTAVYRWFRRRFREASAGRGSAARRVATIVLAASLVLAAATGGAALYVPAVLAGAGFEYLTFVFTSGVAVMVGVALGGATWLATRTFRSVAARAEAVGDATVLVSFFWVGLAFLALYHALWVLYMLILITMWPLRAVVPK